MRDPVQSLIAPTGLVQSARARVPLLPSSIILVPE